jgi:chromosome segregation ATPase
MTAVVALSTRIDSLVDATLSARSALNERLGTHADEVRQVARTAVTDLEEYRRSHDRAVTELQRSTTETAETLHRLTERVEHLTTIAGDDEPLVDAVRTVFEANAAEQRSGGQRAEDALAALADRLDRLEGALSQIVAGLTERVEHLTAVAGDDEPWAEAVRQVFEEVVGARRGDAERTEEALSGIPERLGGVERALSELAEDLAAVRAGPPSPALELDQAQVRAIAVAVAGMLGDRLPAPPAAAYTASDTSPEQQGEARPSTPRRRSAPLRATSPRRR